MLGPQTLDDYGYLKNTKGLSVGHLGYFGQETVSTEGFRGLLDVWESRNILNLGSQKNLDLKGSGSEVCGCRGEDRS